jgi:SAM-dependent methyltransferase
LDLEKRKLLRGGKALNLACGTSYISSPQWTNVDWSPSGPDVIGFNLLRKLPFKDNYFDLVYSSHFIEHLLYEDFELLLKECYRVLAPGGVIRLVTPDWDEMISEYMVQVKKHNIDYAEYIRAEILDQCVRTKPGGRLKIFHTRALADPIFANYLKFRSGKISNNQVAGMDLAGQKGILHRLKNFLVTDGGRKKFILKKRIEMVYISLIVKMFPDWFRRYHVSLTDPGERHLWLFTYNELFAKLEEMGFINIKKLEFSSTQSQLRDVLALDTLPEGGPRKGALSMFIEASKT